MLGVELPPAMKAEPEDYVLIPENFAAARLFDAVLNQWRLGSDGRPIGLEYAACESAARGLGVKWKKEFWRLQAMEDAALAELRKPVSGSK